MNDNEYYDVIDLEPSGRTARPKKRKRPFIRLLSLILCGLIFGAMASVGWNGVSKMMGKNTSGSKNTSTVSGGSPVSLSTVSYDDDDAVPTQSLDVSEIAEGMMPAMVSITNVSVQEVQSYFGLFGSGRTYTQEAQSSGTGIIIGKNDTELLIVTNNHVIENAKTLSVCFVDNEVVEATTKGTDPDNDLAVIAVKLDSIQSSTMDNIKIAQIGDSDKLKVGQQVVAIGNALGYGQSVTTGIVSALNRQLDTSDAIMIQTDAAINPGNSGGALLNMSGEVIGINSAKFSSTEVEGMGYAISITTATPIIEDLMNRTTRELVADKDASYLGISGEDITSSISATYGIPKGIYITSINKDSPLKDTDITTKSVLTKFDGIKVTSVSNLSNRLKYYAAGETVEITVEVPDKKGYTEKTYTITLGKASEHSSGYSFYSFP